MWVKGIAMKGVGVLWEQHSSQALQHKITRQSPKKWETRNRFGDNTRCHPFFVPNKTLLRREANLCQQYTSTDKPCASKMKQRAKDTARITKRRRSAWATAARMYTTTSPRVHTLQTCDAPNMLFFRHTDEAKTILLSPKRKMVHDDGLEYL